ncbi:hypothetical protein NXS98_11000 [Fontisphaera persica]|uniref:hypothetical protein n=1 Tax=Fontisphaera persica TaxID=2974023 RepID=UPI0024BFCD7C|nr:hypothetical protein [Fontisphaera persica]WCJ58253.1 hypothetical protein NXS98_11000 [Fontisphaera persica]
MKLSQRSYPHPVVGNRDDVPNVAFQAAVEMSSDKQYYYIKLEIKCSSVTINQMLINEEAKYVLHVECSNTLFRKAFMFSKSQHRISIPADCLYNTVEVNVFVCSCIDNSGYSVEGAHQEYEDATFQIRLGDILAVAEGYEFNIEDSFDSTRRIGSIMQIEEAREEGDLPMRVDFNADKIRIILSKSDFGDYKLLKAQEGVSSALTATIVLPALVEALHCCKAEEAGQRDDSLRWMRLLRKRITLLNLESETDNLVLAQKLLELPLRRALTASKQVLEAAS